MPRASSGSMRCGCARSACGGRSSTSSALHFAARSCVALRQAAPRLKGHAMRNLLGKIALTTGSALVAGGLLVVAYLSAGTFILAGILSAVFLIGERIDVVQYVFAPIAFSGAII